MDQSELPVIGMDTSATSPQGLRSRMVDYIGNDLHIPYTSSRTSSKLNYAAQLRKNLEVLHQNTTVEQDSCMTSPEVFECEPEDFDEEGTVRETRRSGIFGTFANLANSIIGGGIVSIPYAVQSCGFLSGMFLLISVAILADKSLRMIVDMASFHPKLKFNNVHTYESLASYPFGRKGEQFILYATFFLAYGAMICFLIIIKDTLPTVLGIYEPLHRDGILLLVGSFVVLPLSLQRDMASLSFTSLLSIISVMSLLGFVAWFAPVNEAVMKAGGYWAIILKDPIKPTIIMSIAILSDGFACQHAAFVFSSSLSNLTRRRWAKVTKSGIGLVGVTFCIIAVVGCLAFQDNTRSDILNNFSTQGLFGNAARSLLAITMCFTYPLDCFVCRHVLTHIIYGIDSEVPENNTPDLVKTLRKMTVAVFILTMIPALLLDDLGIVLALTGCLGASTIAYIAPGSIYLGLYGQNFLRLVSGLPKSSATDKADEMDTVEISYNRAKKLFMTSNFKKCLWYVSGLPLWCYIASVGKRNVLDKLDDVSLNSYFDFTIEAHRKRKLVKNTAPSPKTWDFIVAIFFISFGTFAAVAGLLYEIYEYTVYVGETHYNAH